MSSGGAEGKHKQGVAQSAQRVVGEQTLRKPAGSWLFTWEQENPSSPRLQGAAPRTQQFPDNSPTQPQPLLRSLSAVLMKYSFPCHCFPTFPLNNNLSVKHQNQECHGTQNSPALFVTEDPFPSFRELGLNRVLQASRGASKYWAYFMIPKCTSCPGPKKQFKLWIFAYYWLLMHGKCCIWLMHSSSLPHFSVFPQLSSLKFRVKWITYVYAHSLRCLGILSPGWGNSTSLWQSKTRPNSHLLKCFHQKEFFVK